MSLTASLNAFLCITEIIVALSDEVTISNPLSNLPALNFSLVLSKIVVIVEDALKDKDMGDTLFISLSPACPSRMDIRTLLSIISTDPSTV